MSLEQHLAAGHSSSSDEVGLVLQSAYHEMAWEPKILLDMTVLDLPEFR